MIYQLPKSNNFETTINGKHTHLFVLKNKTGMQIALTDYGARLVSALVPDKNGNLIDVILGFDSIEKYINAQEQYHGATIGRVSNRIAKGKFNLNGTDYTLNQNNNGNALHGGPNGFHTKVWDSEIQDANKISFYYVSPDGEEGFPAEVQVNVTYELTDDNEIRILYRATTDKQTILNLTNHAYFNLNGEGNGDILDHKLQINCLNFIPLDDNQIPRGDIKPVGNTAFDFTSFKKIGKDINSNEEQIRIGNGYDHSYVNENSINQIAASVSSTSSGINLEVYSDLPTIQLYTGNFIAGDKGKYGNIYAPHTGFCLEAQHYTDSPNQGNFPDIYLNPGQEYSAQICFKFNSIK